MSAAPAVRPTSPAAEAFGAVAERFDERYGAWLTVAAQRRAVRRYLEDAFPAGSRLLELGGGTGEDAIHLASKGRHVLLTDGAFEMVEVAERKITAAGLRDSIDLSCLALEELSDLADERERAGVPPFDGAYSNFAALNCVDDLAPVGAALARLLRPSGRALLVVFGPFCLSELAVLPLAGDAKGVFRRFSKGKVAAKIGGREFTVRYPAPREIARAFGPRLALRRVRGVGVFVPGSAVEPGLSRFPGIVNVLETLDRVASAPL
ncbi:MAG TPA: class I SAM-dependent methyltransferase, partial [Thermoanaerobaculia bacterium]|nr:class I SAM-dependent methyltransferase [Thermoanaerobaculia bacterium]